MSNLPPTSARRTPDYVLGVFARERLSEALSATHRAGFGPYTKVLDGKRSSTAAQLSRAGLEIAAGPTPGPEDLLIVVQAPGRVDRVAELFHQLGAQVVAQAQRIVAQPDNTESPSLTAEIAVPALDDTLLGREA